MSGPQVGEVYDLRSAGQKERGEELRPWEVISGPDEDAHVLCRSIPRGVFTAWPLRHFIPENRLKGVSKHRKLKAGAK